MLRMNVEGVGFDHRKQTVVVLKDVENKKLLPIWIGPAEARSIALFMEGAQMPRPLSHDLMLFCVGAGGGQVARVVINDLQDGTYYATIDIHTPSGLLHIDARPSDALALAVRAQCPVFVDGAVLNELIDIAPESEEQTLDEVTENLKDSQSYQAALSGETALGETALGEATPSNERGEKSDEERFRRLLGDLDL